MDSFINCFKVKKRKDTVIFTKTFFQENCLCIIPICIGYAVCLVYAIGFQRKIPFFFTHFRRPFRQDKRQEYYLLFLILAFFVYGISYLQIGELKFNILRNLLFDTMLINAYIYVIFSNLKCNGPFKKVIIKTQPKCIHQFQSYRISNFARTQC